MKLIEDSRQQAGKHDLKHLYWAVNGDQYLRCKLPFGDYALPPKVAVDTKENMGEIANNIGGTASEHRRFREELKLAQEYGCKLYVLVENLDGITCIDDVWTWENPRLRHSSKAIDGPRLCKAMKTMQERYGVTFLFCKPDQAAAVINKLLGGERDGEN